MAELKITLINGQEAGATMQLVNKELREANKELAKAKIGTDEYVKASAKVKQAEENLGKVNDQIKATTTASDTLKKSWNTLPGAQYFNKISESFGMMKTGVGGLVSQFGVLKTAIAATGLGLVLLIVGSLINYFSKLEAVTNILKGAWDGLTAAFNVFTKAVATLDFTDLGDNIATAAKEAYNLVEAFDQLEDKARDLSLSNAEAGKEIDQLLLKSKNISLSYEERLAILDKVGGVESQQHKKRLEYASEYLATVQREVDNAELQNEANDELKDKLIAAKIAVVEADRETLVLQEKIENRRSALLEKQQAERDKAAAKREADGAREAARVEKENTEFLRQQEKFNEEKHKQQEKEDLFQENRRLANLNKEKLRIQEGMAAAADALAKQTEAIRANQEEQRQIELAKQQMQAESLAVFNEGAASFIALLGADEKARKKNAQTIKTIEAGRVAVNGIAEISEIAKTFASLGPLGQILAAFQIAFSVARTAAGLKRISSQKFELGGPVTGPRHSGGGVPIEAEGGEFIFSRKAVSAIGVDNLSAVNSRYTFANGGQVPVSPYNGGTAMAGAAAGFDYEKLAAILDSRMENKIMRLQVVNNVGETEKGIKVLNTIRNESDV